MADILMVEDDVSLSAGLTYALEKEGYHVSHCRNIADAVEETAAHPFDLALLDLQLPDGFGREVASALKPH
ncbi:MAG: response regulator, partial [Lachnospiraceae bacterium]|nr:response regulator [Lachnospiraceae bacterium]